MNLPWTSSAKALDENIAEAKNFAKDFEPQAESAYKWVFEYAMNVFRNMQESVRTLDAKADSMARYLGPGSGILGVGFAIFVSKESTMGIHVNIPIMVVGVLFLVVAIWCALKAIRPCEQTVGASVNDTIKTIDYYKDENLSLGAVAAALGVSIAILRKVAYKKSAYLRWSQRFLLIALVCFALAFLIPWIGGEI